MQPFDVTEIGTVEGDLNKLWIQGGFPDSFLAKNEKNSFALRRDLIRTYLERDVPQFGPRIPAETLERLWTMLAHCQGTMLNASRLASGLSLSAPTVTKYVDLLVDLLLVRRLRPLHANIGKRLVKAPKIYVRDSGLLHALLGIVDYNAVEDIQPNRSFVVYAGDERYSISEGVEAISVREMTQILLDKSMTH